MQNVKNNVSCHVNMGAISFILNIKNLRPMESGAKTTNDPKGYPVLL